MCAAALGADAVGLHPRGRHHLQCVHQRLRERPAVAMRAAALGDHAKQQMAAEQGAGKENMGKSDAGSNAPRTFFEMFQFNLSVSGQWRQGLDSFRAEHLRRPRHPGDERPALAGGDYCLIDPDREQSGRHYSELGRVQVLYDCLPALPPAARLDN